MYSQDARSKETRRKSIVAIIGTTENGDVLELPLLTLASPYTIMQLKDENGDYIFQNIFDQILEAKKNGIDDFEVRKSLVDNKANYSKLEQLLIDMFELYNFTNNGVFYIDDSTWTPAQNLESLGPQFVTSKGSMQLVGGFSYDADSIREADWITLSELRKNKSFKVSPILTSRFSTIDGYPEPVVQAGHPFILVTNDTNIGDLGAYYAAQFTDPANHPKKVKLVYVLPPSASFQEWVDQKYAIINEGAKFDTYIGNDFTAYNILKLAINDQNFVNVLNTLMPNTAQTIINKVQELNNMTLEQRTEALFENVKLNSYPTEYPLFKIFNNVLKEMVYTHNKDHTIGNQYGVVDIVQKLLDDNKYKIYYDPSIPKTENAVHHGPFLQIKTSTMEDLMNGTIDGKPFRVHGKIDSCAFRADMSALISSFLAKKTKHADFNTWFSTDDTQYKAGNSNLQQKTPNYVSKRLKELNINLPSDIKVDDIEGVKAFINANTSSIAFILNNKLYITEKNSILDGDCIVGQDNIENRTTGKKYSITIDNGKVILTEENQQQSGLDVPEGSLDDYIRVAKDMFYNSTANYSILEDVIIRNNKELQEALIDANQNFSDFGMSVDVQSLLESYPDQKSKDILTKIANYLNSSDEDIKDACAMSITLKY